MSDAKVIVDKLWNYCNILRDDGLSYGDYVEQLTYLLFLKMADEQRRYDIEGIVPEGYDWPSLLDLKGESLEAHYIAILSQLGKGDDMLGVIFRKAQNRIQDPAKLERLIKDLIGREQWMSLDADVKGDAYEGLLEKNAGRHQVGRGAVLHATSADRGDCRRDAAEPRHADIRPGVRHRRILPCRLRLHPLPQSEPRPRSEAPPALRAFHGVGDCRQHRPAVRHESLAARH